MSTIRSQVPILLALLIGCACACAADEAQPETITNALGLKLVLIPAGEFSMGAEEDRKATLSDFPYCPTKWLEGELPRHKVRITKPFYMGMYEVTLREFLEFRNHSDYRLDIELDGELSWGYEWKSPSDWRTVKSTQFRPWAPGWVTETDHPAVYVSWNDATAFCKWLSKKEDKAYRLPTEAEWEYACRAGSNSRFFFGNDPQDLVRNANASDKSAQASKPNSVLCDYVVHGNQTISTIPFPYLLGRDGYAWTAPVGKFRPNGFGLYDMHGNAWEWCSDWYDEHYYEKSPADDPKGPDEGSSRVLRGGGFDDAPADLRCARRCAHAPSYRIYHVGFRVVCEP